MLKVEIIEFRTIIVLRNLVDSFLEIITIISIVLAFIDLELLLLILYLFIFRTLKALR